MVLDQIPSAVADCSKKLCRHNVCTGAERTFNLVLAMCVWRTMRPPVNGRRRVTLIQGQNATTYEKEDERLDAGFTFGSRKLQYTVMVIFLEERDGANRLVA